MRSLVEEARARALDVLRACVTPLGLRASAERDGYREVWTRDAVISLLGVCAAGAEELVPALRRSLESLTRVQSPLGYIPINVGPDGRRSSANAGAVDGNLWYVLGHYLLDRTFAVPDLLEQHREAIGRAMLWARYQDSDDDRLLEVQEAADWADLLAYRGKVLYGNVLYTLALDAYAQLARRLGLPDGPAHAQEAERVRGCINALLWVDSDDGLGDERPPLETDGREARRLVQATRSVLWSRPYYLPWIAFRDFGDWCDVLGNCLAILAGVADPARRDRILRYFDQVGVALPYPAKALYPPIHPGHKDWRDYYRNGNHSLPDQYHNGGCWPFIGGFLIASEVLAGERGEAARHLERLAAALREGRGEQWEFNEWHHGVTGRPMGAARQAWSAAMYLFAYESVDRGRVPLLLDVRGGA